jgi:hypothetical protein
MEVADTAVEEIIATTFGVPVKRLILVKGTDYQDQAEEISYRIRALDPDLSPMSSSTSRCAGCAPNGTGSRPCPPSPTGGKSSSPGTCTAISTRRSPCPSAERG